jgi:glutaminyl-peptide cyclotransferase
MTALFSIWIREGLALALAGALLALSACDRAGVPRRAVQPRPAEIWKAFSGENALAHTAAQVAAGPRPSGSSALEKTRQYLVAHLEANGWEVERQSFTGATPEGPVEFVNLIARFRGAPRGGQQVILGSHYDTKRFDSFAFVGANDAGSSTGALLEIARVLALDPALAWRAELVFFDGEECQRTYGSDDGLHGSKHYAKELKGSGRAAQFRFGVLLDMIGDADLRITLPSDSPPELLRAVFASAAAMGVRDRFALGAQAILDDHVPVNAIGVPMIDVIDFAYPPWHTEGDTMDKVDAKSIQIVGSVTLHVLRQAFPER